MNHPRDNALLDAEIEAESLPKDRKAPLRRCIVTRESLPKDQLIRFVVNPDGVVTADLACKLPGRGMWVRCDASLVQQAVMQRLFPRAAKAACQTPDNLGEQVAYQLRARALQSLAMANKAGALLSGFDAVGAAIEADQVLVVLHATDASDDGIRKLSFAALPRYRLFNREEQGAKLGREEAVHLALLQHEAGAASVKEIQRFTGFMGISSL